MKTLFLTILLAYSIAALPAPNKTQMSNYKNFLKETNQLRIEQELKIFKKQQEFLSNFYKKKMIHLKEIGKMQEGLEWGNKEKNKKIIAMINKKKKAFKSETKKLRQKFFMNDLRSEIENFNLKMRQRKQTFGKNSLDTK